MGASIFCKFFTLNLLLVSLFGKNSQLGTIVVVALLMHKAPEAIGFGTFLVDKKCTKAQTLTNLIVSLPTLISLQMCIVVCFICTYDGSFSFRRVVYDVHIDSTARLRSRFINALCLWHIDIRRVDVNLARGVATDKKL